MRARQGQHAAGIEQLQQGLAAFEATGAEALRPYFLTLLAEAYGAAGQAEEGLSVVTEALAAVDKTGERFYEAELYRLKGGLTLTQSGVRSLESRVENQKAKACPEHSRRGKGQKAKIQNPQSAIPNPQLEEAEACFHKAIAIARHQGAKSLELRAVMSLSRLWQQQGKRKQARQMLADVYGWFTEGFDMADLQEAKTLLAELR